MCREEWRYKDLKQRNQLGAYSNHLRKYTENLNWDNGNGKERKIYSTSQMEQYYRYKINRTCRLSTYYEGEWGINSDCRFGSWMPGNIMPLTCGSHLDFVLDLTEFYFYLFTFQESCLNYYGFSQLTFSCKLCHFQMPIYIYLKISNSARHSEI